MVVPRVGSCDLTVLVAVLVEFIQKNQNELVCGEEKT